MRNIIVTVLSFFFLGTAVIAQQQGFGCIKNKELISLSGVDKYTSQANPVTEQIPLFGKLAKQNNRSYALPFGVGINAIYYDQHYLASDLLLSSDSTDITAVADSLYQNTSAYEMKLFIRPNIWVFPFLNIYGIYGYTKGVISPNLTVSSIKLQNVPVFDSIIIDTVTFEIQDDIGYVGPTYGIGATFSTGTKYMFFMVDYNYTVTDPTDLDDNLHNHFLSPKAGIFLGKKNSSTTGALWVGAMYISNDQSFTGKIDIEDINPLFVPLMGEKATYQGTIKAKQRWNMVIGGSIVIADRHHFVIEAGFIDRKQLTVGYDFRF